MVGVQLGGIVVRLQVPQVAPPIPFSTLQVNPLTRPSLHI